VKSVKKINIEDRKEDELKKWEQENKDWLSELNKSNEDDEE